MSKKPKSPRRTFNECMQQAMTLHNEQRKEIERLTMRCEELERLLELTTKGQER